MAGHRKRLSPITPAYRQARWKTCQEYILKTRTLDEARELASRDRFGADTSVWISAFGKLVAQGKLLRG